MDALFAIEAGAAFGLGHFMRCRSLASELARRGRSMAVALRGDADLFARWPWPDSARQIPLPDEPERAADALLERNSDEAPGWTIVDGYGLAASTLLRRLRAADRRTVVIDDIGDTDLSAAAVINQNTDDPALYAKAAPGALLLLGPRFALVADEFRLARRPPEIPEVVRRVLVAFGGADRKRMTQRVLQCLATAGGELSQVDVVVGPFHAQAMPPAGASFDLHYHATPPNLVALMTGADAVISASGSTCWETCCLGRPLVSVQTVENQREIAATLRRSGAALTLDFSANGFRDDKFLALWQALQPAITRRALAAAARDLVDGLGANRVADALGL
jgi:UDP-2,4-diacetamido-2,4,6-trideoxy-beta-L-altropyranose hydrolase